MNMCATCPAFEARKAIPREVADAVGATADGGLCRLEPVPVPKNASDWCMHHPNLRGAMWTREPLAMPPAGASRR